MQRAVAGDLYSVWKGVARHETEIQGSGFPDRRRGGRGRPVRRAGAQPRHLLRHGGGPAPGSDQLRPGGAGGGQRPAADQRDTHRQYARRPEAEPSAHDGQRRLPAVLRGDGDGHRENLRLHQDHLRAEPAVRLHQVHRGSAVGGHPGGRVQVLPGHAGALCPAIRQRALPVFHLQLRQAVRRAPVCR